MNYNFFILYLCKKIIFIGQALKIRYALLRNDCLKKLKLNTDRTKFEKKNATQLNILGQDLNRDLCFEFM